MSAALGYVFVFGGALPKFNKFDWVVLSILINSTHFMASYRLLYDSWDHVKRAPWAAIYVPILLLALLAWRVVGPGRETVADAILLVSSLYLGVHYTGQAWGMVASFGHLAGTRFERSERHAIRSGMRILLSLHVLLALRGRFPPAEWMSRATYQQVYAGAFQIVCVLAAITLVIGAWGFWRARRRGQTMFLIPGGPLWVQLSHALQYLSFPLRVEANRFALRQKAKNLTRSPALHIILVYIGLVVAGTLALKGAPLASRLIGQGWYSTPEMRGAFETWVLLINIHHFFIDGAVWKLRNPEVRRELFSHVHELEDVAPDRVSPS
jgi:hypothetical protein